ncbi:hypothetical protein JHK82_025581 [Glycine max]|nr:hypothetical protein JHK82_025581 [Glycine max]
MRSSSAQRFSPIPFTLDPLRSSCFPHSKVTKSNGQQHPSHFSHFFVIRCALCCCSLRPKRERGFVTGESHIPSYRLEPFAESRHRVRSSSMLDGLLGRGFAAKCKSLMKLTKNRIDLIRRKRKATEKFLKKDIADLLANGLDDRAYGRAEGLFVELTLSSCYDFVDQSCDFVLKHLPVLQKLSGCPEEVREAISSLMFAAARFSDLPELRDLRQIFQDRYGSSLECYVNQEFATNLNSKSSTLEKKVHLMQDIASEFAIKWDSKAFELRMSKCSVFAQDATPKGVKFERSHDHPNDRHKFQNGKEAVVSKGDENHLCSKSNPPIPENGFKPLSSYDEVNLKRDSHGNPLPGREELSKVSDRGYWKEGSMLKPIGSSSKDTREEQFEGGSNLHDSWGNARRVKESQDTATARKSPGPAGSRSKNNVNESYVVNHGGLPDVDYLERKNPKDETFRVKPFYNNANPPAYTREEQFEGGFNQHDSWGNARRVKESQDTATSRKSPGHAGSHSKNNVNKPFAVNHGGLPDVDNSERRTQKDETPRAKPFYNNAMIPPPYVKPHSKLKNNKHENNSVYSNIDSDGIRTYPLVHEKPDAAPTMDRIQPGLDDSERDLQATRHARLSKHGHEKALSVQEDATEAVVLKQKSTRRKHSKSRSTQDDASNEDAEVVRKPRSRRRDEQKRGLQILFDDERHKNDEEERVIDRLLIHYSKKPSINVPEKTRRKYRSCLVHQMDNSTRDGPDETPEMVTRPPRSVSLPREQTEAVEVKKVYARAASFQPERLNEARHVHPKLPDCDDLAARIAALRGT